MESLIALFGTLNVVFLGGALLNFFMKYLNRTVIIKLPKTEAAGQFANQYRAIMRYLIVYHRWFGLGGGISVLLHFLVARQAVDLPISGIIVGVLVLLQVALGLYGFYIKKGMGIWQKIHRINGLLVFAAIINHLASIHQ